MQRLPCNDCTVNICSMNGWTSTIIITTCNYMQNPVYRWSQGSHIPIVEIIIKQIITYSHGTCDFILYKGLRIKSTLSMGTPPGHHIQTFPFSSSPCMYTLPLESGVLCYLVQKWRQKGKDSVTKAWLTRTISSLRGTLTYALSLQGQLCLWSHPLKPKAFCRSPGHKSPAASSPFPCSVMASFLLSPFYLWISHWHLHFDYIFPRLPIILEAEESVPS